jgi:hypothetical protein
MATLHFSVMNDMHCKAELDAMMRAFYSEDGAAPHVDQSRFSHAIHFSVTRRDYGMYSRFVVLHALVVDAPPLSRIGG